MWELEETLQPHCSSIGFCSSVGLLHAAVPLAVTPEVTDGVLPESAVFSPNGIPCGEPGGSKSMTAADSPSCMGSHTDCAQTKSTAELYAEPRTKVANVLILTMIPSSPMSSLCIVPFTT